MIEAEERKRLFTVTAKDCVWAYSRGSGAGGQKRNKTSSAARCTHEASGAMGYAEDTRSQSQNRQIAFGRMARTKRFQEWLRVECARVTGVDLQMREEVERQCRPGNLRVEGKTAKGLWERLEDDE